MKFFAKTDYGKVRQINQDYYVAENRRVGIFPNIFIVADGVGSNPESSFASKHCSDFVLSELALTKDNTDYVGELGKAYRLANRDLVYRIMANPSYKGMGTTMVALTVINSYAIVANVGDSRCYHINNEIKQVTLDHSIAEELVRENAIERGSPKYKEMKNQLSRAFGAGKNIEADFFTVELMVGDYLLLCSDGLSNMITNEKILEIIKRDTNIETKVDDLINEANNNGGKDNIAVVLIYIDNINKENAIFEKEQLLQNNKNKEVVKNLREIIEKHTAKEGEIFRKRSRRRKEGDDYEE